MFEKISNVITDIFHKREFGIEQLLTMMESADRHGGWENDGIDSKITTDNLKIEFVSTTIEPTWEFFDGACVVNVNDETIYGEGSRSVDNYRNEEYTYGKYKTREETAKELLKMLNGKECVIEEGNNAIKCIFKYDEQEENKEDETEICEDEEIEI